MRKSAHIGLAILLLGLIGTGQADQQRQTTLVEDLTEVKVEEIPYEVEYIFSRSLGPGRIQKVRYGVNGEIKRTYRLIMSGGRIVDKELIKEETTEPIAAVFHMGRYGFSTDRGSFKRAKVRTMESTAYTPSAGRANPTYRTATGRRAAFGVVAVDPRVIPLNTLVYVEGYGFAIAADTGGAIKGNRIDVCLESHADAMRWGRRSVRVHIFQGKHVGKQ